HGDTDADGHLDHLALRQAKAVLGDALTQLFRSLDDLLCIDVHQYQQELLAAQAERIIAATGIVRQGRRHLLQDLVTAVMAVSIVDLLEVIDIDDQYAERASRLTAVEHLLGHHYRQELAVEQARQHIAAGFQLVGLLEQAVE